MIIGLVSQLVWNEDRREKLEIFDTKWSEVLQERGHDVKYLSRTVRLKNDDLTSVDALILPGGGNLHAISSLAIEGERDSTDQSYFDLAVARNLPVIGICRGAQLLAHLFGAKVEMIDGHVGKQHGLQISTGIDAAFYPAISNSFHNFGIKNMDSKYFYPLAFSSDGFIEAFKINALKAYGIMWHPERSGNCEATMNFFWQILEGS